MQERTMEWRYKMGTSSREKLPASVIIWSLVLVIFLSACGYIGYLLWRMIACGNINLLWGLTLFALVCVILALVLRQLVALIDFNACQYRLDESGIHFKGLLRRESFVPWTEIVSVDLCMVTDGKEACQAIRCQSGHRNLLEFRKKKSYLSMYKTSEGDDSLSIQYCFSHRSEMFIFYQTDARIREFQQFSPFPLLVDTATYEDGASNTSGTSTLLQPVVIRSEKQQFDVFGLHGVLALMPLGLFGLFAATDSVQMDIKAYLALFGASIMLVVDVATIVLRWLKNKNWRIVVTNETLEYVNRFGVHRVFSRNDISWSIGNGKILLWHHGKCICQVPNDLENIEVLYDLDLLGC